MKRDAKTMLKMLEDERGTLILLFLDCFTCAMNWLGAAGLLAQGFGIPYCLTSWANTVYRYLGEVMSLIQ